MNQKTFNIKRYVSEKVLKESDDEKAFLKLMAELDTIIKDDKKIMLREIKQIAKDIDSSNKFEVDLYLKEIISLCNKGLK